VQKVEIIFRGIDGISERPHYRTMAKLKKSDLFPKQAIPPNGGRPRVETRGKALSDLRPWEKLDMSRRTWERRRKEAREKAENGNG
jgi:hypothetical protein